jgi:hypothetical protein
MNAPPLAQDHQDQTTSCSGCHAPLAPADVLYTPDTARPICQQCLSRREIVAHEHASQEAMRNDSFSLERKGMQKGVAGGLAMMAIAVVWFVAGWAAGYIFFYPPILFIIGVVACIRGGGNKKAGF